MLLLEDSEGGVFGVNPRIRDRIRAKLHADRLDRALAAGDSPDSDALLALRSQALSSTSTRNGLAAGLERIILETTKPRTTPVRVGIPRCRRGVVENLAELDEIRRHLSSAWTAPNSVHRYGVRLAELGIQSSVSPRRGSRTSQRPFTTWLQR